MIHIIVWRKLQTNKLSCLFFCFAKMMQILVLIDASMEKQDHKFTWNEYIDIELTSWVVFLSHYSASSQEVKGFFKKLTPFHCHRLNIYEHWRDARHALKHEWTFSVSSNSKDNNFNNLLEKNRGSKTSTNILIGRKLQDKYTHFITERDHKGRHLSHYKFILICIVI